MACDKGSHWDIVQRRGADALTFKNIEEDLFQYALTSNHAWASYKSHQNPALFQNLAKGQSPKILWLGCSDSRVSETTILGLQPGDVFVHRSFGNIISPTDINTQAAIEFAVGHLRVQHVVMCGHSNCCGSQAALAEGRVGGVLDVWISPLKAIKVQVAEQLASAPNDRAKEVIMAEKNVTVGVAALMANYTVQEAVKSRGLQVHGCFYDIPTGRIRDLGLGTKKGSPKASTSTADEIVRGRHAQLVFRNGGSAGMAAR